MEAQGESLSIDEEAKNKLLDFGSESMVLETNSSFGSTNSSISMSNLHPIGVYGEDGGINIKSVSSGSIESADPQSSAQPMTSLKDDENNEMIENSEIMPTTASLNQIFGKDTDVIEYAQAPCTPGLLEEPNLSNIQETSACDDHLESENPSLTEFAVKDNLENASSKSDLIRKNEMDGSLLSDVNPNPVLSILAKENCCLANDMESNQANP